MARIPPLTGKRAARLVALALVLAACGPEPLQSGLLPLDAAGNPVLPEPPAPGSPEAAAWTRPNFHDFGRVPWGEAVEHVFRFRNTDPLAVVIRKMDPSCSCTVPRIRAVDANGQVLEGELMRAGEILAVPSGGLVELAVRVDTREVRIPNQDKLVNVRLLTSSANRPFLTVECHLVADQALRATPEAIELGRVPRNAGGAGWTEIVPIGASGTKATGLGPLPEGVEAELAYEAGRGADLWVLEARLLPPLPSGRVSHAIQILTDRPAEPGSAARVAGPPFEVTLTAYGVEDVELDPPQLVAHGGNSEAASGEARLVSRLPGHRFKILAVDLDAPPIEGLAITFEPESPDGQGRSPSWVLHLAVAAGTAREPLAGRARALLDDPQIPEVPFQYLVRPR